jgi:hypothetical protein
MLPRATEIRKCSACQKLVAERESEHGIRSDFVLCPWCASSFWFKTAELVADVSDGQWRENPSVTELFNETCVADAQSIRAVFGALFPTIPPRSDGLLDRLRARIASVARRDVPRFSVEAARED